jgi:hypothetical protein
MNIFLPLHLELLQLLNKYQVEYLLIGGFAVVIHGYERTTGDMDLWLKPDNDNKYKFLQVLKEMNFEEESIEAIGAMNFEEVKVFSMGEEPDKIDFLTKVQGLKFEECYPQAFILKIENTELKVLNFNDLIVSKMVSDRVKDKADIEELTKINNAKK